MENRIKKNVLPNGVTVLYRENRLFPLVALQVWYKIGSINEAQGISGISHFIEHMLFKGTENRKVGDIGPAIEKAGGRVNAATSKDFTYYHTELPSEKLEFGLEILADIAYNATFPENEMEKERTVILEEIKRSQDNPDHMIYDMFMEKLFYPSQYNSPVIGTGETVSRMKQSDLLGYYKSNYIPQNMTVVVCGDFDEDQLLNMLGKYFNKGENLQSKVFELVPPGEAGGRVEKRGNAVFPYLITGVRTVGAGSEDQYALDLWSGVLGMGASSRLNTRLKEEERIVLGISCGNSTERYTGFFYVFANCEGKHLEKVQKRITEELAGAAKNITDEEIDRVKALLETQFILETETNDGYAMRLGISNILGDYLLGERYLAKIKSVRKEDLLRVYEKYIGKENFVTAVYKPEK